MSCAPGTRRSRRPRRRRGLHAAPGRSSTRGGLTTDTLAAAHTTGDDVPAALFHATFAGGIRPPRQEGAYARPAAWRGLYALLDLPREVPHADAVRQADTDTDTDTDMC
ncbi:DUF6183 family protein [Streptomyces chattanoogensis]|uniref:DUF6183 family protein n=1 Tax=Streptomyces chattanoogensis TaxID=66876 RepID=UPI0005D92273|nr:hypothetical protein T261_2070 [Streptomyces lydicus]